MNNIFDIKRFGLLAKKDFLENWKKHLMTFLSIFGILSIFLTYRYYEYYDYLAKTGNYFNEWLSYCRDQVTFVIGMFFIFGVASASSLMEPINSRAKKISYLMNPASSFEKYFLQWGRTTIVFILLYIVAFFFADFVQWLICSIRFPSMDVQAIDLSAFGVGDNHEIFDYWRTFFTLLSFYFFIQSLFVLGSTFWPKFSVAKTFCAALIIIALYLIVCGGLISSLFADGADDFMRTLEYVPGMKSLEDDEGKTLSLIFTSVFSFFAITNWTIGFFRFKETEIIKRF